MRDEGDKPSLDPKVEEAVVAFLREWLPAEARTRYREMILANPATWKNDPHFAEGIIVRHALRGNGLTEKVLGIPSLDEVWPDLLARAVEAGEE